MPPLACLVHQLVHSVILLAGLACLPGLSDSQVDSMYSTAAWPLTASSAISPPSPGRQVVQHQVPGEALIAQFERGGEGCGSSGMKRGKGSWLGRRAWRRRCRVGWREECHGCGGSAEACQYDFGVRGFCNNRTLESSASLISKCEVITVELLNFALAIE